MEGNDIEEWLEEMFAKVGGMWSDLRQAETVNYVESRVQSIGIDVKGFCSEFIQEVLSSSPAQTTTDLVDDMPLDQITETVPHISLTEQVSNEMHSVEIPGKTFEEMSGSVDEPDVIVPVSSLDHSSCRSSWTEYLSKDDPIWSCFQPETSTCDLEDENISLSESWDKEYLDTMIHFAPRDCENEESLDTKNHCACGTGNPVLTELPVSFSELVDVAAGDSELREWDYTRFGSYEEFTEHETMLGKICIMTYRNNPCPDKNQSMKLRAYMNKLRRKPSLKVAVVKDQDSIPANDSSGNGHSNWQLELLPSAPEFELIEHDWEDWEIV